MPITAKTMNDAGLPGTRYKTFIETGFYKGAGVKAALDAGFEKIYSIEIDPRYVIDGRALYPDSDRVEIIHADSLTGLTALAPYVFGAQPCVFWLDAHTMGGVLRSPVLRELDVIEEQMGASGVVGHAVLIDDRRLVRSGQWGGVTDSMVTMRLRGMFPSRRITYLDGFVKQDIYASIPSE